MRVVTTGVSHAAIVEAHDRRATVGHTPRKLNLLTAATYPVLRSTGDYAKQAMRRRLFRHMNDADELFAFAVENHWNLFCLSHHCPVPNKPVVAVTNGDASAF
jgi:hypothetical protein